jgi:Domain of unknown function (DU1801)
MGDVPGNEIDAYLDALEEPKRSTLARLRDTIMAIVPDAEQCISYGMPAFRLRGKTRATASSWLGDGAMLRDSCESAVRIGFWFAFREECRPGR